MFCKNCGAEIKDNMKFCTHCGTKFEESQGVEIKNRRTAKNTNKTVGIITVCIGAVLVAGILFGLFGGRSYKKTVKLYMEYSFEKSADGSVMAKLLPEEIWNGLVEHMEEEEDLEGEKEVLEYLTEMKEEAYEQVEEQYGEDFTYTYKIIEEEDMKNKDIREIREEYEENDVELEIKEGKSVTLKIEIKSKDKETSKETEMTLDLIKVGRSWYLQDAGL